jgi:hypothetical protein
MSREWTPGDVALVTANDGGHPGVAFRVDYSGVGHVWWVANGYWRDEFVESARPLVVIDPEDMRAVERLQDLYIAAESRGLSGLSMLDALREFADPKPPCGASLTLGKAGVLYRCSEVEGHDGPHLDGTCTWTAKS